VFIHFREDVICRYRPVTAGLPVFGCAVIREVGGTSHHDAVWNTEIPRRKRVSQELCYDASGAGARHVK